MPLGARIVTATKDSPRITSHQSTQFRLTGPRGMSGRRPEVKSDDRSDTKAAPITAP